MKSLAISNLAFPNFKSEIKYNTSKHALQVYIDYNFLGLGYNTSFVDAFNGTTKDISDIGYGFYGGFWAYGGWANLNYIVEELKNPIRDLKLGVIIGISIVTSSYVMVNVAYLTVMTSTEMANSEAVAVVI